MKILGGTKNTAIAALRGDIGASAMRTRVAAGKLQYINSVCNGKKDIVKELLEDMQEKRTKWWKMSEKYIEDCGTTIKKVKESTREKLKELTKK